MRFLIPILLLSLAQTSVYSQQRYKDSLFEKVVVKTYGYADTLQLDFYEPEQDKETSRPLILLVHGGGFAIGKRDNPLETKFCTSLAKKGYAVASISYRLTRKGESFGCDCPRSVKINTFLSATEDILKATNFLASKAKELQIDQTKIALVGSSAGAEAVLNTVFMKHGDGFCELPYSDLSFAALVSFAGAVLDARYINRENMVPTMLFHGKKDTLVPYGMAAHHYCETTAPGYLMLDGSESISQRIETLGGTYQMYYDVDGNHDWANLAYAFTDEVAGFLYRTLMRNQKIQSKIQLRKSSE